ncbi:MAG: S16 family serine protease, partial [bacterium]
DFSDHFLNTPFDLSRVLFIATANMLDPIPAPLRDRMEVIRLSGYTPEEKAEIATRFLIPRQVEEHGMTSEQIAWTRSAIAELCSDYTYEAGVRNLDRQIAALCRKVARRRAEGDDAKVVIGTKSLDRLLGPPPFSNLQASDQSEIGLVNGLAWTEAGGEVLTLEANLSHGRGLVLTGQLGDVMKESGQTALSYVRSILSQIGASERTFSHQQVHVHVPAGATPKDGPSAGVAIATALASLAAEVAVRADVAMTGEVTLRGRVLPVGGVREKALAALRAGIRTIVIPERNVADLREIPKELKKRLDFVPVRTMRDVLDAVLVSKLEWSRGPCPPTSPRASGGLAPAHAAESE